MSFGQSIECQIGVECQIFVIVIFFNEFYNLGHIQGCINSKEIICTTFRSAFHAGWKNQNKHSTLNLSFDALSKWHEPDISIMKLFYSWHLHTFMAEYISPYFYFVFNINIFIIIFWLLTKFCTGAVLWLVFISEEFSFFNLPFGFLTRFFGVKYLFVFFSSRSHKTREKYIIFAQFVYFLREVGLLFNFWKMKFTIMSKKKP